MNRIIKLDQSDDPRLSPYRDLRWDRKPLRDAMHLIAEGRLCVQRLLESNLQIESVLAQAGKEEQALEWTSDETPVYSLPVEQLRNLVGFDFHRGMMACGIRPDLPSARVADVLAASKQLGIAALRIVERENLGGIMRSAAGFGVDTLLLGPGTADPYSRRAIRVSMGTVFRMKLYRMQEPVAQLLEMREAHVRTIATTLSRTAKPLQAFQRSGRPCLLLVGNEADGLADEIKTVVTDELTIPMGMGTDSLNVSVAAAVFLHSLASPMVEET